MKLGTAFHTLPHGYEIIIRREKNHLRGLCLLKQREYSIMSVNSVEVESLRQLDYIYEVLEDKDNVCRVFYNFDAMRYQADILKKEYHGAYNEESEYVIVDNFTALGDEAMHSLRELNKKIIEERRVHTYERSNTRRFKKRNERGK